MHIIDVAIVGAYMVGLLFMGYFLSKGNKDNDDYFLAGRSMPWWPVALSVAATTLSANSFVGGPGWAYNSGMMAFGLQLSIPIVMIVASVWFVPLFYNLKVTSIYEYLEMRLGVMSRTLIAIAFIITSIIQVSSMVYTPSLVIQEFTGWGLMQIIPIIVIVAIIYTILGGIKAVIWTDVIQMVILWGGLFFILGSILSNLDIGFFEAIGEAKAAGKLKGIDFSPSFKIEGTIVAMIGFGFMWLRYYCFDQAQVQRMLTCKSMKSLKYSLVASAVVMNVGLYLIMILGVLLFVFYGGKKFDSSNQIMISYMIDQVPVGILGLLLASMFAAVMSSLDSYLNSISTSFVKDIYGKFFTKNEGEVSLKLTMAITFVTAIVIVIVTYMAYGGTTKSILQVVGSYVAYTSGPMLGAFLLAFLTKRANDIGVTLGFFTGSVVTWWVGTLGINWGWKYVGGALGCLLAGYIYSLVIPSSKSPEEVAKYTYKGIRSMIAAKGEAKEEGVSVIPGRFDKPAYLLLGFFCLQIVVLLLGNL